MAPAGSPHEDKDKRINLKRRRPSIEDETENIPPVKKSSGQRQDYFLEEDLCEPAYDVVIEASSSDDEDHQTNNQEFKCPDIDFDADTFFSPSPSGEQTNYVLSPLENVARGDSTPHSSKRQASTSKPDCTLPCLANEKRKCPLPILSWADPEDVWMSMCRSDIKSKNTKSENMFDNHPHLQPRMRAILLDWLNEVCEVYKLHRETYHLTVDYIDRYLSATEDVLGSRLQLIGITCLFIAAKVEEVYPPKIREFAYVTDGACTEKEILLEEKLVLKILTWDITPITVISWLNVYLQLAGEGKSAQSRLIGESDPRANSMRGYTFVFPQYSSLDFVVCGQLLDLAVLDVDVNRYSHGVIAAAVIAHCFNKELALRVSGCTWASLEACFRWLAPFAAAVRAEGTACAVRGADAEHVQRAAHLRALCPALNADESHRVQTHNVTLDMFDQVCQLQLESEQTTTQTESAPSTSQGSAHVIYPPTPPQSDQKSPKTPTTKTPCNRKQSECAGVGAPENRLAEVD